MQKVISYYVEGISQLFSTEEEAIKAEKQHKERTEYWKLNTAKAKYDKLCHDLEKAMIVWEGTMATCTYDTIRIKSMVNICKDFYEENKHNLQYY